MGAEVVSRATDGSPCFSSLVETTGISLISYRQRRLNEVEKIVHLLSMLLCVVQETCPVSSQGSGRLGQRALAETPLLSPNGFLSFPK